MLLKDLLHGSQVECVSGDMSCEIQGLAYDSRRVEKGFVFFCIAGNTTDGHDYIADVVEKGAAVIVVSKEVKPLGDGVTVLFAKDVRWAMAYIAAAYYGNPASSLKTIGITGTKGKTTSTYMMKSILESVGHRVGLIGTIEVITGQRTISSSYTTPESIQLQAYLREMVDAGCDMVVMEVSSLGLKMHRSQGFVFDIGIFTNLQPDHIGGNEHADFAEYLECKRMLFSQCRLGIINQDDPYWEEVTKGHLCQLQTYGITSQADLRATDIQMVTNQGELGVSYQTKGLWEDLVSVASPGKFTVYNSLCAMLVCNHFGVKKEDMHRALQHIHVKGRIEMIKVSSEYTLMIDYAHNAMALQSLLSTLQDYKPNRLVCLFGCGGNRARQRRFEMGRVSGELADLTIITSDNPRDEEPEAIVADIVEGIGQTKGQYVAIIDRKEAIAYAMANAKKGDIVVLAGKGHEDYQEIKGIKYPMDERDLIRQIQEESRT